MRIGILLSVFGVMRLWKHAVGFSSSTRRPSKRVTATSRHMLLDPTLVQSVMAGSFAGIAGSAVSMPLDKLKTLSQISGRRDSNNDEHDAPMLSDRVPTTILQSSLEIIMQNDTAAVLVPSMMLVDTVAMPTIVQTPYRPPDMLQLAIEIWKNEGWKGFFSGSQAVILGTGLHKAVSFTTNACVLDLLRSDDGGSTLAALILAASSAGIAGSFILTPMDRIKATMQTKSALYSSELECLTSVVQQDGWMGFFTRGLGATMMREVPSECIYFGLYGYLMSTTLADTLGPFAPLFFGAISGCASWIPVFPIDTVRTLVQTQYDGKTSESCWNIAQEVYRDRGIGGFFDGISPRLMRAALAHAVTFYFYDLTMSLSAAV